MTTIINLTQLEKTDPEKGKKLRDAVNEYKEFEKTIPDALSEKIREQNILIPVCDKCYGDYDIDHDEIFLLKKFTAICDNISKLMDTPIRRFVKLPQEELKIFNDCKCKKNDL